MAELLETIQRLKKDLITSSSSIPPLSPVEQHALRRKIVRLQLQLHNKKEVGREKRRRERERTMSLYLYCAYVGNQQITRRMCLYFCCAQEEEESGAAYEEVSGHKFVRQPRQRRVLRDVSCLACKKRVRGLIREWHRCKSESEREVCRCCLCSSLVGIMLVNSE